jgi:hypothetical protein
MSSRQKNWFNRTRAVPRASHHRRLCFEGLEQRLALTWVGVPPTAITPPTSAVAVTLNSQADAGGTASIASTEVDYYAFTATSTGTYTISATTPNSRVDTVLGVFSADGKRLAYNDDIVRARNTDSRLTINLTAGSRYYVGITNYTSSSRGTYTWTVDGPSASVVDDSYENNDSFRTAYNLGTLSAARTINQLVMADSQDWYQFTTSAAGTSANSVSISYQNSQGNLQLALYNSAGTLLATSQGTGNSESISLNGRIAGTYYVRVYGNAGALNPSYSLSVNPPTASTTTTTTTSESGFQIVLSMSGLTTSQQTIFQQAADRWEEVIIGDLPDVTYRGQTVDDLLISTSAIAIDGVDGVLGQAGADAFRSGSYLPYHGIMQFDTADLSSMEQSGLLFSVVVHEMGHVLGFGIIWEDLGLLSGAGTSNPTFTGAQATAAYNQLFGTSARGVPVENTGGSGTADAHWRETVFGTELMTGWVGSGTDLPLSIITVASLADIGYTVNYAAADAFTPSTSASAAASRVRARTTTAAGHAFGRLYAESTVVDAEPSLSFANATPRSRPTPRSLPERLDVIDVNLVDLVVADSSQDEADSPATCSDWSDTQDEYDIAWEQFGIDWDLSSAFAVA